MSDGYEFKGIGHSGTDRTIEIIDHCDNRLISAVIDFDDYSWNGTGHLGVTFEDNIMTVKVISACNTLEAVRLYEIARRDGFPRL